MLCCRLRLFMSIARPISHSLPLAIIPPPLWRTRQLTASLGALLPVPCAVPRVVLFSAGSSTRPAPWRAALLIQFKRCVHLSHVNIHALSPSQLPCRRKEKKSRKRSSCNPPRLAHMGTIQYSVQGVFFGHNIVRFLSEILFEQGAHSDQRICGAAKPKSMHPCSPRSSSLRFRFLPPTVATHGLSFQQKGQQK